MREQGRGLPVQVGRSEVDAFLREDQARGVFLVQMGRQLYGLLPTLAGSWTMPSWALNEAGRNRESEESGQSGGHCGDNAMVEVGKIPGENWMI